MSPVSLGEPRGFNGIRKRASGEKSGIDVRKDS